MHALDAHLYSRNFRKFILAIQAQKTPSIDIIDHQLIFPLLGISKLHHAHRVTCAIESVKKLFFDCSQLLIDLGSKCIYQSKTFPLSERQIALQGDLLESLRSLKFLQDGQCVA